MIPMLPDERMKLAGMMYQTLRAFGLVPMRGATRVGSRHLRPLVNDLAALAKLGGLQVDVIDGWTTDPWSARAEHTHDFRPWARSGMLDLYTKSAGCPVIAAGAGTQSVLVNLIGTTMIGRLNIDGFRNTDTMTEELTKAVIVDQVASAEEFMGSLVFTQSGKRRIDNWAQCALGLTESLAFVPWWLDGELTELRGPRPTASGGMEYAVTCVNEGDR